jgi:hypothetical protein
VQTRANPCQVGLPADDRPSGGSGSTSFCLHPPQCWPTRTRVRLAWRTIPPRDFTLALSRRSFDSIVLSPMLLIKCAEALTNSAVLRRSRLTHLSQGALPCEKAWRSWEYVGATVTQRDNPLCESHLMKTWPEIWRVHGPPIHACMQPSQFLFSLLLTAFAAVTRRIGHIRRPKIGPIATMPAEAPGSASISAAGGLGSGDGREQRLLEQVLKTSIKGDPQSVLNAIDSFAWGTEWLMNVGDVKGLLLDAEVKKALAGGAKTFLELGAYCEQRRGGGDGGRGIRRPGVGRVGGIMRTGVRTGALPRPILS